jgi:hypothetical protein
MELENDVSNTILRMFENCTVLFKILIFLLKINIFFIYFKLF